MENKTKKTKVDYAAIIREYEMYARGRSLKQFCDDSDYVFPNVLRYYRKCFWNSKSKLATSPEDDKPLVPLEIEPTASTASVSPMVEADKSEVSLATAVSAPSVQTILQDGNLELSNNLAEQMMRHIKMNLKNCLNIGSLSSICAIFALK